MCVTAPVHRPPHATFPIAPAIRAAIRLETRLPTLYLPTRWLVSADPSIDDPDVFPTLIGQSFLLVKKPIWSTKIATTSSGRERRRKTWSYPRWQFKVAYDVLRDLPSAPDLERLIAFFLLHAGQYQEFLFLDPSDNMVTGQPFGIGDGVTTRFQLTRSMSFGSSTFSEPIGGVTGTPTVFADAAPIANFTVGPRGSILFASPPAAGKVLTWTGRFMFACRFDDDELELNQMMQSLWSQDGLSFTTTKG